MELAHSQLSSDLRIIGIDCLTKMKATLNVLIGNWKPALQVEVLSETEATMHLKHLYQAMIIARLIGLSAGKTNLVSSDGRPGFLSHARVKSISAQFFAINASRFLLI